MAQRHAACGKACAMSLGLGYTAQSEPNQCAMQQRGRAARLCNALRAWVTHTNPNKCAAMPCNNGGAREAIGVQLMRFWRAASCSCMRSLTNATIADSDSSSRRAPEEEDAPL